MTPRLPRVLALVHQDDAASGIFRDVAHHRGVVLDEFHVDRLAPIEAAGDADALIVLGGDMQATEEDRYAWLAPEIAFIADWIATDRPLLGICLGAQLLARAVGGIVRPASSPEIGWYEVTFDAGEDPLLGELDPRLTTLQWHSYEIVLPEEAITLGRSERSLQAFRVGDQAWGLQFHPEVTREGLDTWISEYSSSPAVKSAGLTTEAGRAATDGHIEQWNEVGRSIAERFFDRARQSPSAHRDTPTTDATRATTNRIRMTAWMTELQSHATAADHQSPTGNGSNPHPSTPIDRLTKQFERDGTRTVQFGACDLDGVFRGKRVPAAYFLDAVATKGSMIADCLFGWDVADTLIDGLQHSGWHTGYADLVLMPDLSTVRSIPWEPGVATAICDINTPDGKPLELSPRYVLQRQIDRAATAGYEISVGYELEFYLFKETAYSVLEKDFRDLTPATPGLSTYSLHRLAMLDDVLGEIREQMNAYDIPVEAANTEYGPGQVEINIHHGPPRETADRVLLYKDGVRQIAERHGYVACFMAKFSLDGAGSSGHIHQSLRPLDNPAENAFWDPERGGESELMRRVIAGQLEAMPEQTLFFCPTVNSYKRKVEGSWAPTKAAWGRDNRTAALRVIAREPGSCRIEHRLPGADANPYLAIAACIAGALHGIEHDVALPDPVTTAAYTHDAPTLPGSLEEAILTTEAGAVSRAALGDEFLDHFLATRRWERDRHREAVSDWELRRYFGRI